LGLLAGALAVAVVVLAAAAPPPAPERIAVEIEVLGVGDGTRTLERRRLVLDIGMAGGLEVMVGRRDGGLPVRSRCRLALETARAAGGRVEVALTSVVQQGEGTDPPGWERGGKVSLLRPDSCTATRRFSAGSSFVSRGSPSTILS
jgi:hypothetical protein